MSAGPAEIEIFNWSAVVSAAENGAEGEELIQRVFAMKDVSAAETVGLLQIEGRDDLAVNDQVGEVRGVGRKGSNHGIAELVAAGIPASVFQFIRSILNMDGHHVRAFRRKRGVDKRWNRDVHIGLLRKSAILGFIE